MVKTPTTRHSGTDRDPVTIDLEAVDAPAAAAPGEVTAAAPEASGGTRPHGVAEPLPADQPIPALESETAPEPAPEPAPETAGATDPGAEASAASSAGYSDAFAGSSAPSSPAYGGSPPRDTSPPPPPLSSRGGAAGFLAGLLGGAAVVALAAALQFAGLLPAPGPASSAVPESVGTELAALRADLDALKQGTGDSALRADLDALRAEVQNLSQAGGGDSAARLEQLAASLEALQAELAGLKGGAGGGGADLSALTARLQRLETAVAALPENSGQQLTALGERIAGVEALVRSNVDAVRAGDGRLGALEQAVSSLTAKVDAQASQPEIARSIAASALKAAIDRGAPFLAELETFAAIAPQGPELTQLRSYAEAGVATEAEIREEMPDAARAMIAADSPPEAEAGFFDRLLDSAASLVEVRPIGAVEGAGVPETVARMEVAVNRGDLAAALAEYDSLAEPAKAAGAAFAEKIRARVEALRLADQAIAAAMVAG